MTAERRHAREVWRKDSGLVLSLAFSQAAGPSQRIVETRPSTPPTRPYRYRHLLTLATVSAGSSIESSEMGTAAVERDVASGCYPLEGSTVLNGSPVEWREYW